jgi:NAD(P)-dependent dehydrogenase (short-subunit alcohol dehydrogenase family)
VAGDPGRSPFDLTGKTALVTGASRGIGAAIAVALDRAGARVALTARSTEECRAVADAMANRPTVLFSDLADDDAPEALAYAAVGQLGGIDVLVNNAGVGRRKPSTELTGEDIDFMYRVNVRNLLLLTTHVIPSMVERGGGSVVNISSISGISGAPMRAAYAATKGAVDGLTRSLAMEYGPAGVRFNSVAPGVVETAMWTENLAKPGVREEVLALVPLRRLSTPEDVADVVVFLASDAARYITGETISADGGMAKTTNLYPSV